jgi:hypothetical protein
MDEKVIWIKKAKCAGTSLGTSLQDLGLIYYVNPHTTLEELEHPDNRVICIREALFPYGKTLLKGADGGYRLNDDSSFVYRLRGRLRIPFQPLKFMATRFPQVLARHRKIAIVRNPYDKFISSWRYLKGLRDLPIQQVLEGLPNRSTLHDWIHITQLQVDVMSYRGEIIVDDLIYMESDMEAELNAVFADAGIEGLSVGTANASRRKAVVDHLEPAIARRIHEIYRKDFEQLGYSTDYRHLEPVHKVSPGRSSPLAPSH